MGWSVLVKYIASAIADRAQRPTTKATEFGHVVDFAWMTADAAVEVIKIESIGDVDTITGNSNLHFSIAVRKIRIFFTLMESSDNPRLSYLVGSVFVLLLDLVNHVISFLDLVDFSEGDLAQCALPQDIVDVVFIVKDIKIIVNLNQVAENTLPALKESAVR